MLFNGLMSVRRMIFDGVLWALSLVIPWSISSLMIWMKAMNCMLITFRGNEKAE